MPSAVLARVVLGSHHESTGKVPHVAYGRPVGLPHSLSVFDAGEGSGAVLLIRFDADGKELTDTWHASIAEAFEQAEFEYRVRADEWTHVGR